MPDRTGLDFGMASLAKANLVADDSRTEGNWSARIEEVYEWYSKSH